MIVRLAASDGQWLNKGRRGRLRKRRNEEEEEFDFQF